MLKKLSPLKRFVGPLVFTFIMEYLLTMLLYSTNILGTTLSFPLARIIVPLVVTLISIGIFCILMVPRHYIFMLMQSGDQDTEIALNFCVTAIAGISVYLLSHYLVGNDWINLVPLLKEAQNPEIAQFFAFLGIAIPSAAIYWLGIKLFEETED